MHILVLDDNPHRHHVFAQTYAGHDVIHVYNYNACISHLDLGPMSDRSVPWDLVHLDHDLGEFCTPDVWVDSQGRRQLFTGAHVTLYIAEQKIVNHRDLCRRVIVHSVNGVGGQNMVNDLSHRLVQIPVDWEPFGEADPSVL